MTPLILALFGWLVPGGSYLLMRRYAQFAAFAILVTATFGAGLALQGGFGWPQASELQGLDTFTKLLFQGGALVKALAGGPFLLAQLLQRAPSFLEGRLHEYGTTLLVMAGVFNVLAVSSAFELRKKEAR
uniref:DUF6677 domain-containing protein n=1 Tax=Solibacter usitatus (strain Ellin6076) TaxID=234267 RepID=Q01X19_SOLUE